LAWRFRSTGIHCVVASWLESSAALGLGNDPLNAETALTRHNADLVSWAEYRVPQNG